MKVQGEAPEALGSALDGDLHAVGCDGGVADGAFLESIPNGPFEYDKTTKLFKITKNLSAASLEICNEAPVFAGCSPKGHLTLVDCSKWPSELRTWRVFRELMSYFTAKRHPRSRRPCSQRCSARS